LNYVILGYTHKYKNINGKVSKVKQTEINILSKNNTDFRNLKKIVAAEYKIKEHLPFLLHQMKK
jgi:hypothetical protein